MHAGFPRAARCWAWAQPRRVNVNRLPEAQDQLLNPAAAPVERQVVKAIAKQQLNHDQAVT